MLLQLIIDLEISILLIYLLFERLANAPLINYISRDWYVITIFVPLSANS